MSFSCHITVAKISSVMWKRNGESGHPHLDTGLRGAARGSSFPLSSMNSTKSLQLFFVKLRKFSSSCSFLSFYYKWALYFLKNFFLHRLI